MAKASALQAGSMGSNPIVRSHIITHNFMSNLY